MSEFPLIVSFYTKNTLYQLEVQNLVASCEQFNLELLIEGIDTFGSWELNCAYKPFFIYQKLNELKKPLLWVDADGVFVKNPSYIEQFGADFSVRMHPEFPQDHPSKVMSGTMFINYTEKGIRLVRLWAEECIKQLMDKNRKKEFLDQAALRNVIFSMDHAAKVEPLPLSYAKVFDNQNDINNTNEVFIEHYQASRRLKNLVNNS